MKKDLIPVNVFDFVPISEWAAILDHTSTYDATNDLNAAAQAAAGKILIFPPGAWFRTSGTVQITSHGVAIEGNRALIDYYGNSYAFDFSPVLGVTYLNAVEINRLSIFVNNASATALRLRGSHSTLNEVDIGVRWNATNATGIELAGDFNGTGPYYNLLTRCTVQCFSPSINQRGVVYSAAANYRGPNGNTWIGGRVGQCSTAFSISGIGNNVLGVSVEGVENVTSIGFLFDAPNPYGSFSNTITGAAFEAISAVYKFTSNSASNVIVGGFITGAWEYVRQDNGINNMFLDSQLHARMPLGVQFKTLSNDPTVLDYYEEGTWNPTVYGVTTSGNYTIEASGNKYTRIGNQVTVHGRLIITRVTAGSGTARFGGLPYPKISGGMFSGSVSTQYVSYPAGVISISAVPFTIDADSTYALVGVRSGTSSYDLGISDLGSYCILFLTITYQV